MVNGKIRSMELDNFSKYIVYESGKVLSKKLGKYLKPHDMGKGYVQYRLHSDDGKIKSVSGHRLVAETFLPNPEQKSTVNHINNIRDDNRVSNLEWATMSEQMLQAYRMGKKPNMGRVGLSGKLHVRSKPVTNGLKTYESMNMARADGFRSGAISRCCKGTLKSHKGFKWSLLTEEGA